MRTVVIEFYREKSPMADKQKMKTEKKERDDLAKSKDVQFLIQVNTKKKRFI